jgi:hypothetical protein
MSSSGPILPRTMSELDVLMNAEYFVDVQLWPLHHKLNAKGWLGNFTEAEKRFAAHLLNGFLYFCQDMVDQMLKIAFQGLSSRLLQSGDSYLALQSKWQQFVDTVIVTYVTGERPNPTDSGFAFARKARQILGIDENRIKSPEEALRCIIQQESPVLFVDDFVGSGNQMIETWQRQFTVGGLSTSFEKVAAVSSATFYYCPIICTEIGRDRLRNYCPQVLLQPAHVISNRYNAVVPDSIFWPRPLWPTALSFLRSASTRAGIPDNDGNVNDWRGFHKLGLALAIGDSVPDATLPIFYWEENDWIPLIRRT